MPVAGYSEPLNNPAGNHTGSGRVAPFMDPGEESGNDDKIDN
jgi:hypothetical protein